MASETCETCRFWSEMCAEAGGDLPGVRALCLASPDGPYAGKMTGERHTCRAWKKNMLGAIDNPPGYGEATRAEYERAEGPNACVFKAAE